MKFVVTYTATFNRKISIFSQLYKLLIVSMFLYTNKLAYIHHGLCIGYNAELLLVTVNLDAAIYFLRVEEPETTRGN